MLLHIVYTVITPDNEPLGFILPLTISLDADTQASLVEHEGGLQLLLDRKVDHTSLEVVKEDSYYKEMPDGMHQPIPTLRLINDEAPEHILSQDFISALTFISDVTTTLSYLITIGLCLKWMKITSC